jgi:heavy metal sensor kinase
MRSLSISVRLTTWYAAVLLLGLTLFGLGMWFALQQRLVAGVDTRLAHRVDGLRTLLERQAVEGDASAMRDELAEFAREMPDVIFQLEGASGPLIRPAPNQPRFPVQAASAQPMYQTTAADGQRYRVVTTRIVSGGHEYDALVASSLADVDALLTDFRQWLWTMIPVVLISACLGGYWVSRRALAPVDGMTRMARSISAQNLSGRLPVPQTGDEVQRLSETWNDMLQRLDAAVRRMRQFTADASHELRTPVALIRATAELALRRERAPDEYRKSLRDIKSEAERMTDLTESLLTLARADSNSFDLPLAPADLNGIVAEVVRHSQPVADLKGVDLRAETAENPVVVRVNADAIRRLLLILIDNAVKHTAAGGSVTVNASVRDHQMILSVVDSGDGIDPDVLPHIFERFYRSGIDRAGSSGAGLGLSIAQVIARVHRSEIVVESAPGKGSRFSLALRN